MTILLSQSARDLSLYTFSNRRVPIIDSWTPTDRPSVEAALAAIKESKNEEEVFTAVNGFLAEIQKTSPIFQTLPGQMSIKSVADVRIWLNELKTGAEEPMGNADSSGDALAKIYAVMRAAARRLDGI